MRSTLWSVGKRLVRLYLVSNLVAFGLWAAVGYGILGGSSDSTIPGFRGSPVEQVFWYALGSTYFTTGFVGGAVLLVGLGGVAVAVVGFRPRDGRLLR